MAKNENQYLLLGVLTFGALTLLSNNENTPIKANTGTFTGLPTNYIKKVYNDALQAHKQYPKVPIELIIAHSGLESAWGKKAIGNNFFGVKAGKNYNGKKQLLTTTEILPKARGYNFPQIISITPLANGKYKYVVKDYFRVYDTPLQSFLDYCKLITTDRYANNYSSTDVFNIINELKKDGYATGTKFVSTLSNLVIQVKKYLDSL